MLFSPPRFGRLRRYLFPPLCGHPFSPRLPAHAPQRYSGGVLAVVGGDVLNLAGGYLGYHDGVGGAFLPFMASGH